MWQSHDNKGISSLNSCVCPHHVTALVFRIFYKKFTKYMVGQRSYTILIYVVLGQPLIEHETKLAI
jgi:hypothetical protein